MSLPIILAIVLTAAVLAWGAVYLVVRRQREAALNKMFRSDPIDAEIGREALRRVFGILADEDPAEPLPVTGPSVARAGVVPPASMAAQESAPLALGPGGAAPGSAARGPSVARSARSKPDASIAIAQASVLAAAAAAAAAVPVVHVALTPGAGAALTPPLPAAPSKGGFRLFAPDNNDAAAAATPLLPHSTSLTGGLDLGLPPDPAKFTPPTTAPLKPAASGAGRSGSRGDGRSRFVRDSLGAVLVTAGIVFVAVAIFHPRLSILSGGVSAATAPVISEVSFAPVATTVVQGSGPVTIDVLANDSDPDGDPLTIASITQGTNGQVAIAASQKFLTYDPTGSFIGTDSFTYTASDGRGGLSVGTVLVTVVKDTFAPVTTAPRALIVAPPIGSSAPITLTWSGTDRGFGIKTYQLQVSRNHAPWASVTIRVGAHAARQTVALNSFYQYRVRAIDRVGNVGRWASLSFTPTLYRETSATYSGTWKSAALSGALNGSVKYTSGLGAVASMTCTCSAFAWIGPKGPTRGTAQVYVDTILIGTFSEKSTTTLAAQEIMSVTWASRATHKIGISVAGTGRVDVDGFLILH
jgi:hypothetical protein